MNKFIFTIPFGEIARFCRRWKIKELAIFGSALREDFTSESDVDFLATFEPDAEWSLLDHLKMQQELQEIIGRSVDLISRRALEHSANWLLRREIMQTAQVIISEPEEPHASG